MPVDGGSGRGPTSVRPRLVRAGVAAGLAVLLGGLTSYAQGWLPDAVSSLANSASGWTILAALLVLASRLPARWASVLGAAVFVLLVLGYTVVSEARGFTYSPWRWSAIGVVAGPFVGVAVAWLRERDYRAALGTAVLAGIGIGEGSYGLTAIADSTHPAYWTAVLTAGVLLVAWMLATRIRGLVPALLVVVGTLGVAVVFNVAYRFLG